MVIKEVITTINQMQADGVIDRYAIGGAVGATFYLEPIATLDVDIFVTFRAEPGSLLVSPQPIFDYLKARGGTMQGEYIVVAGWPVQFLPPVNSVGGRGVAGRGGQRCGRHPRPGLHRRTSCRHCSPDRTRQGQSPALQFVEAGVLDAARFQAILARHGLVDSWRKFERQFLSDAP